MLATLRDICEKELIRSKVTKRGRGSVPRKGIRGKKLWNLSRDDRGLWDRLEDTWKTHGLLTLL